jgi:hypothetical protein
MGRHLFAHTSEQSSSSVELLLPPPIEDSLQEATAKDSLDLQIEQ